MGSSGRVETYPNRNSGPLSIEHSENWEDIVQVTVLFSLFLPLSKV